MSMPPGGYPGQPQDPHQQGGGYGPPPGSTPGYGTSPGFGAPGSGTAGYDAPGSAGAGTPGYGTQEQPGAWGAPGQPGQTTAGAWPAPGSMPTKRNRKPVLIAIVAVVAVVLGVVAFTMTRGGGDPKAQADKFMTAVQSGDFSAAKKLLCKDGQDEFTDISDLRGRLASDGIKSYTVGDVSDGTFQGDKRKDVKVNLQLASGKSDEVTLSMTKEGGKYLVCGF
jgi:Domain of unknown function (DUF4878)